jgi:hypothetical protein
MHTTTTPTTDYESIEFTLTNGQSDYNLDTNQTTFLSSFGANGTFPTQVLIRTDYTITVKLNSTSGHSITITSTDSPFAIRGIMIRNLYLSNASGNDAAVKLLFQDVEY